MILALFALLVPTFSLLTAPPLLAVWLRSLSERSPTTHAQHESVASVGDLSPVIFSAQEHLTSELLRTLSRMAASKPTSWLSQYPHILSHLVTTWGP
jgi:hypothetical protein